MDRLEEADLFTEARGSMYLYRLQLEKEANNFLPSISSSLPLPFSSSQTPPSTHQNEEENNEYNDDLRPLGGSTEEGEGRSSSEMEDEMTVEMEAMKRTRAQFTPLEV